MVDCIVVGGGVVGLSIAWELSCRGIRVRVLERDQLGMAASWAGAGILPAAPNHPDHPYEQLQAWSHQLHPEWADRLQHESGIDTGFRRSGALHIARSAGDMALLAGSMNYLASEGIAVERLSPDAGVELEPKLDWKQVSAAYRIPKEYQLRNPHHLRALEVALEKRGVLLREQFDVTKITQEHGRWEVAGLAHTVDSDPSEGHVESFAADWVCLTAGPWTREFLGRLQVSNDILPIRGQMALFQTPTPLLGHVINEGPRYLVPRDDGHLLVGSCEEEVGFQLGTTDHVIADLCRMARRIIPELQDLEPLKSWSGLRPGTIDGFPYIGFVPQQPRLLVAAGHFRSGIYLSPGTAMLIADMIEQKETSIDTWPFRLERG